MYKRQLSDSSSYMYMYPETVAKKVSDAFVTNRLDSSITELEILCDSCGGQNKNVTVIRMCHHLVHTQKRFKKVVMVFPVKGQSYLECDKNIGLIKMKTRCETPEDWFDVFRTARSKPSTFEVIKVQQEMIKSLTEHFNVRYESKKLAFPSRSVRELKIENDHPVLISYRESYKTIGYKHLYCHQRPKMLE